MPKLRRLAGRDVVTILQGFGFQQVSQRGSHVKLVRVRTEGRQVLTVPPPYRTRFRHAARHCPPSQSIHSRTRPLPPLLFVETHPVWR
ncbi:MAG: type II toxin-antitoxin system HicA family toxin [Nitrospiraceae bacterium]|nr:type II toxin-antitoxin system HicA family toxin [Nitrospiraceae bacterium]